MRYHFINRLNECMTKDKMYLNPKLTLDYLAEYVGTNRTYLSNYINKELNLSFFNYVNGMRLNDAVQLLMTTDSTLEVIAERSGFNSLSTFRRYFIYRKKCTPTVYKREHINEYPKKEKE